MDTLQKVVWSEGMFLSPHHFQQQDRFWEHQLGHCLRSLQPLGYGLTELRIDEDALGFGELLLGKAIGLMPDGLPFAMPDVDELPSTRSLDALFDRKGAAFDNADGPQGVYLAAPKTRPGVVACAGDGVHDGQPTRFRLSNVLLRDENDAGGGEREVVTARKNFRLLLEGENLENFTTLKIAELMRDPTGNRVILNPDYVPPCLAIGASPRLQRGLRLVLESLNARASELAQQQRATGTGVVDLAGGQIAGFQLLQLLCTAIPGLRHSYNQPGTHPEQVFLELARLAGALYAFATEGEPKDLPLYLHDDLTGTFGDIERQLQDLLDVVIPTRCTTVRLSQRDTNTHIAELPPDLARGDVAFYLGLHGNVAGDKLVQEVPLKVKIASPDAIDFLVAQALRGVGLRHLSVPPVEIPARPDWKYFQILNAGEPWREIAEDGRLALFLPAEFTRLRLELMAVKG